MAKQRIAAKNNSPVASPKQATPAPTGIKKVDPKQFDNRRAAPQAKSKLAPEIQASIDAAKQNAAAPAQQARQAVAKAAPAQQAAPAAQRSQTSVRTRGGGVQTAPKSSGLLSRIKSRVGAVKQGVSDIARGASSLGKRVAGGVADAATGNKFDFDKRGEQKPKAQDALNRNPNQKRVGTPATSTSGMRPTNTGNARRDNFNAKVNTLKNKKKYGGTGNPITIGDKTYNPQDKGYKDAFNTVSSAMTKSQKNIGVDTSPGKSDTKSLVNPNKKQNVKNAKNLKKQFTKVDNEVTSMTGGPKADVSVGKIGFDKETGF